MDESDARETEPDGRTGRPDGSGSEPGVETPAGPRRTPGGTADGPDGPDGSRDHDVADAAAGVDPSVPLGEPAAREAADAFGVLADPLRVRILSTLWAEDRRGPVAYSDLQEAVGVRDSGRFNYHLSQLTGRFLEKTDDGYGLTATGLQVVDLLSAGAFTDAPELPPEPTDADCPVCDGLLHGRYDGAEHVIQCPDCEFIGSWMLFPPAGVRDRAREELRRAAGKRSRRLYSMAHAGICPFCAREMAIDLVVPDDQDDQYGAYDVAVEYRCDGCKGHIGSTVGAYLYDHPAVVAFRHDHGEAPDDEPAWSVDFVLDPAASELLDDDPLRARLAVERGDEHLELVVDGEATVVEERRVRAP
jgi:DNA-binding transcriptional ArsR family regulator